MFESLKQQPRGMSAKERTRLVMMLAGALLLGGVLYGGGLRALTGAAGTPATVRPETEGADRDRDLDVGPLAGLRSVAADPAAFDATALRHVLREVRLDRFVRGLPDPTALPPATPLPLRRTPSLVGTPKDVAALDAATSAGTLVEVLGTVRELDPAGFDAGELVPGARLWAFALEGEDGARVVVVDGEVPHDRRPPPPPEPGAVGPDGLPLLAPKTRPPLVDGDLVRVRGYVLARRVGDVGPLRLATPTPLLVGREYRPTVVPPPPPASIGELARSSVQDRTRAQTRTVDDLTHYVALHWARARGADALAADLRSGALPWTPWARDEFLRWMDDLRADGPDRRDDPREFTNGARGQVFLVRGVLADYEDDDWDAVGDNAFDVGRRYVYRVVSDHHQHDAMVRFDSPFPITAFPGVRVSTPEHLERVRVYGMFLRNHSYTPRGPTRDPIEAKRFAERKDKEITVPSFLALRVEPDPIVFTGSPWSNPFLWVGGVLITFIVGFMLVMRRLDRRDDERLAVRERAMRHRLLARTGKPGTPRPTAPEPPA
ncbi:MAG: hypothetical protein IT460_09760 [Planctomycetes bacterium]|nr:hypothetical protein [Planctomycetota bacterium]